MKTFKNPDKKEWKELAKRPLFDSESLSDSVRSIIDDVKNRKDAALKFYSEKFDNVIPENLKVTPSEIENSKKLIDKKLKDAIHIASQNIVKFHSSQIEHEQKVETSKGVECWRKSVGIEKVGLYIPGGSAPLFSTILMLGIPAKLAKCKEVVICTPPDQNGQINPVILYTAQLVGINNIIKIGGAQAIAAMAYGTETVPKVYKIFGPGNQYVTKAKELVQQDGIAIDMPAGPSEVLVIADKFSNPAFVASDLLSQAEHGEDSQTILLSNNAEIIRETKIEINKQIQQLPRKDIALKAIKNSRAIAFKTLDECIDFSNYYAPEHLIIASDRAEYYTDSIINAGSVFLGNYSCESAGDYASGTNHTLPTNGYAKCYSGLSLDSFIKKITFQKLSETGLKSIGPAIEVMADAEELFGHKNAVSIRLKEINNV